MLRTCAAGGMSSMAAGIGGAAVAVLLLAG